ncbi:citrulline utilization hydrolase CtlX [Thermoflexibacter ruber]|nr:arginine deiminase-related protein [Thermoflexibacter ruber]
MTMQTTNTVLMVRPVRFTYNAQTALTNTFQNNASADAEQTQNLALAEFDGFVKILKDNGVEVIQVFDTPEPHKPDSIFPNNWVSFHADGTVVLYPMLTENRRWERRRSILELISTGFQINNEIDLSHYEAENKFLEGTGSMILDRENKICYACLSPRTHTEVLKDFAQKLGYRTVTFTSLDANGKEVYHTNVMMCVAKKYVVICLESIKDEKECENVIFTIHQSGKEIVPISLAQMNQFAGNMLELHNAQGESLLVMSEQAYKSLNQKQIEQIQQYSKIVYAPLYTIETNGGGSARCMLAEVHLPKK